MFVTGAMFQLNFTLYFNGDTSSNGFNNSLIQQLELYIFIGYNDVEIRVNSLKPSSRKKRDVVSFFHTRRSSTSSPSIGNSSVDIGVGVSVEELREKGQTIKTVEQVVKDNIRKNLTKVNTPAGPILNEPSEIVRRLQTQTDKTEYDAVSVRGLCIPGFQCSAPNYTAMCVHVCTLTGLECQHGGHCYYDAVTIRSACRCQQKLMTVYYGPRCEEKTGKLEYVVGLSVGVVGGLVLIALLVVCCRHLSNLRKEDRISDKYGRNDADVMMMNGLDDLRSQWSEGDPLNDYRYSGFAGVRNQAYEQFNGQKRYMSEMPSPFGTKPPLFSIKRPQVFRVPAEDLHSPYRAPQSRGDRQSTAGQRKPYSENRSAV